MPEILRLDGRRVQLAEDTPEHVLTPHGQSALYDMVEGETHGAIVLGDDAEAVHRRIASTRHPLTVIGTFFIHTTHALSTNSRRERQTINGGLFAPDGNGAVAIANRYRGGIAVYTAGEVDSLEPYFDLLDAQGTRLASAVTTLGTPEEPGGEFDVLYVPYLMPNMMAPGAIASEEYPIRAAALLVDQSLEALIERTQEQ